MGTHTYLYTDEIGTEVQINNGTLELLEARKRFSCGGCTWCCTLSLDF